eukprot:CAMPEP_0113938654 /NCGR_PEP_ID=MMETSP1339-20121228/5079_1 /TAXON_ID=94617 /ORGANISM="Fibrocapsa japonica" /LENGTH=104 /DNA_ID=CAMNT_0000941871 /DNA_START=100 /DNA_END=414 /DNA_ORIENTATION=+ /assembly_acc=CAM_ASM_000762
MIRDPRKARTRSSKRSKEITKTSTVNELTNQNTDLTTSDQHSESFQGPTFRQSLFQYLILGAGVSIGFAVVGLLTGAAGMQGAQEVNDEMKECGHTFSGSKHGT